MPTSEKRDGRVEVARETADPGGRLRQAREAQGLQLEEVANELRIGASALAALEENRFDALGAPVFARGYLKQVGARLGLDVPELLALYERAAGEADVLLAPTKGIRLRDERQFSLWVLASFALVLVVGGLSYWWLRQAEDATPASADVERDADGPSEPEPEAEPESQLAAALVVEPPVASDDAAQQPPAVASVNADIEVGAVEGEGEFAVADANASVNAGAGAGGAGGVSVAASPASDVERSTVAGGPMLEVIFIEDSWAEISDEDGSRLYRDLGRAGTRTQLPADRNLSIYLGNASGVELRVDGENLPVPGAGRRDVVRFDLDDVID